MRVYFRADISAGILTETLLKIGNAVRPTVDGKKL